MKKIISLLSILGITTLILARCGDSNDPTLNDHKESAASSANTEKMYKVKVTKTSTIDETDWKIEGSTKAPDGTVIFAVSPELMSLNAALNSADTNYHQSRVHNGKFSFTLSPSAVDESDRFKNSSTTKIYIFGISNYKEPSSSENDVPETIQKDVKNKLSTEKLLYTAEQVKNLNTQIDEENDRAEKEYLADKASEKAESKKEQAKENSESIKKAHSSESNTVYGQFEDDDFDEKSSGYYIQTVSALKIGYGVGDDNSVKVVKIDSRELPYSLSLDKDAIGEQITDYTAPDAKLSQTISNKEFIYHSDKLNKDYKVRYQLNTDGELTIIFINQY